MALPSIFSVAAPIVGSLLGKGAAGNAPTIPYSPQVQQNLNNTALAGNSLTNLGGQQTGNFNAFQPTEANTVNSDISLLQQNPYTDSESAALLGQANQGTQAGYGGAMASLAQQLQQRGIGGGDSTGGQNSALSGGLTAIDTARASQLGNTQNQIAQNAIQQRYQNLAQAAQLGQQYGNNLYSQGVGATQAGGQLSDEAAQGYLNAGNSQNQSNQAFGQAAGGLGSGIGAILGGIIPQAAKSVVGQGATTTNPFAQTGGAFGNLASQLMPQTGNMSFNTYNPTAQFGV